MAVASLEAQPTMQKPHSASARANQNDETAALKARLFGVITVLLVLLFAETIALGIVWRRWRSALDTSGQLKVSLPTGNVTKQRYPQVNFSQIYPGLSEAEIELIQREPFELAYRFEPFTGFGIAPTKKQTVEVTPAGFRTDGRSQPQPWPLNSDAVNVFVFGGSTTFGYAVRNQDTLPAALQTELRLAFPTQRIECYNFGCGFYFSAQERIRLERLLAEGQVPKLCVFVDGLNDFRSPAGLPEFSLTVAKVFPEAEPITELVVLTEQQAHAAVESILARFKANTLMISALARQWQIGVIFVGQPVPFFEFPQVESNYPFPLPITDHVGALAGYPRFRQLALAGEFGTSFIWCGDAFAGAKAIMYADSIHYSPEGNRVLAKLIVERAKARGLLKL